MIAEVIDDTFAATFGEVDFDLETEAFFGDEDGRVMFAIFGDAKSAEV